MITTGAPQLPPNLELHWKWDRLIAPDHFHDVELHAQSHPSGLPAIAVQRHLMFTSPTATLAPEQAAASEQVRDGWKSLQTALAGINLSSFPKVDRSVPQDGELIITDLDAFSHRSVTGPTSGSIIEALQDLTRAVRSVADER
ncbi:MAG: hypothetical protein JWM25_212 [Thermoleophilia bacterium]|nr:hypothetical protein [Thermoleophilia bacterium]MCZ4495629.1 hypothetical protein [Thermoleophilia bacterium]